MIELDEAWACGGREGRAFKAFSLVFRHLPGHLKSGRLRGEARILVEARPLPEERKEEERDPGIGEDLVPRKGARGDIGDQKLKKRQRDEVKKPERRPRRFMPQVQQTGGPDEGEDEEQDGVEALTVVKGPGLSVGRSQAQVGPERKCEGEQRPQRVALVKFERIENDRLPGEPHHGQRQKESENRFEQVYRFHGVQNQVLPQTIKSTSWAISLQTAGPGLIGPVVMAPPGWKMALPGLRHLVTSRRAGRLVPWSAAIRRAMPEM